MYNSSHLDQQQDLFKNAEIFKNFKQSETSLF
jgi:hypothetical protein